MPGKHPPEPLFPSLSYLFQQKMSPLKILIRQDCCGQYSTKQYRIQENRAGSVFCLYALFSLLRL